MMLLWRSSRPWPLVWCGDGSGARRAFVPAAGAPVAKRPAAHKAIGLPGVRDHGRGGCAPGPRSIVSSPPDHNVSGPSALARYSHQFPVRGEGSVGVPPGSTQTETLLLDLVVVSIGPGLALRRPRDLSKITLTLPLPGVPMCSSSRATRPLIAIAAT